MTTALTQVRAIAWRSMLRTLLQPASVMPIVVVPALFLGLMTAGLRDLPSLPGFPADSYLDFAVAGAFVQGAMVLGIASGSDLARDLQSGFLKRLSLGPGPSALVLIGQLGGALAVCLLQAVLYVGLALALGVHLAAGAAGIAVIIAVALTATLAFSGTGTVLALWTGSAEAVQGLFPLFFLTLSFSSFFLPRDLIGAAWFEAVATFNPITYLIEAIRSLVLVGWDAHALALGFGLGAALATLTVTTAAALLRRKAER